MDGFDGGGSDHSTVEHESDRDLVAAVAHHCNLLPCVFPKQGCGKENVFTVAPTPSEQIRFGQSLCYRL